MGTWNSRAPGGVIDLTGLTFEAVGSSGGFLYPGAGDFLLGGPASVMLDAYDGVTGGPFGPFSLFFYLPASGSGGGWGVSADNLLLPVGFAPGNALPPAASIYTAATFASLGMHSSPASYVWSWGGGGPTRSITLQVVPEPATWSAVFVAVGALGFVTWNRRRTPPR